MSLPYFKVHPPDFLNDYAYQQLTNEEFGIVMKLFMLMWQSNMQLHDNDINVAWQLRIDPQAWSELKTKLINFRLLFIEDNSLMNTAMKTKYLGAEKFSKQQADKRKKRRKTA